MAHNQNSIDHNLNEEVLKLFNIAIFDNSDDVDEEDEFLINFKSELAVLLSETNITIFWIKK
jgi:hypothetical protein